MAFLFITAATVFNSHAQEAGTEERLSKLAGQIADLQDSQRVASSEVAQLEREIESLRSEVNKPTQVYADRGEFNYLLNATQEMEQKQVRDSQRTQAQLGELRRFLTKFSLGRGDSARAPQRASTKDIRQQSMDGEYVVRAGDTLTAIIRSYQRKGVEVTLEDILAVNPGLDAGKLRPGQRIRIPSPSR
jgi:nucleoid-associated protein YgaU